MLLVLYVKLVKHALGCHSNIHITLNMNKKKHF